MTGNVSASPPNKTTICSRRFDSMTVAIVAKSVVQIIGSLVSITNGSCMLDYTAVQRIYSNRNEVSIFYFNDLFERSKVSKKF